MFGWRQLASRPVVTIGSVLSLGLAIGATSAAFRLVDAVVLRPLPVAAPERLSYAVTWFVDAQRRMDYYDSWDYPTYRRYVPMVGDHADLLVIGSSTGGGGRRDRRRAGAGQRQHYSGNASACSGCGPPSGA